MSREASSTSMSTSSAPGSSSTPNSVTATSKSTSSSKSSSKSSLSRRRSSHPCPLFQRHLQPSSPPPSATKEQLDLFHSVLSRRSLQLQSLSLASHVTIYDALAEKGQSTSKEILDLLQRLPSKKPTDKKQHISLVRYLLISNFHKSCDSTIKPSNRSIALESVKFILKVVAAAYSTEQKVFEQKRNQQQHQLQLQLKQKQAAAAREILVAAKRGVNEQSLQSQNQTTAPATAAVIQNNSNNTTTMGSSFSSNKNAQPQPQQIIEIEDSPPNSPIRSSNHENDINSKKLQQQKQQPSSSSSQSQHQQRPLSHLYSTGTTTIATPKVITKTATTTTTSNPATTQQKINTSNSPPTQNYKLLHPPKPPRLPLPPSPGKYMQSPQSIIFLADTQVNGFVTSYSLFPRNKCQLRVNRHPPFANSNVSSLHLDGPTLDITHNRLRKWDPYWDVVHDFSIAKYKAQNQFEFEYGYKTSNIIPPIQYQPNTIPNAAPLSACALKFIISNYKNFNQIAWSTHPVHPGRYAHNEQRLLVRTLPLSIPAKYKDYRSDTHLWPKGSFLQFNQQYCTLHQRKQQQHDATLWKGLSQPLDLTGYISGKNFMNQDINLAICSKDEDAYAIQVAVCKYISPDKLYDLCMGLGYGRIAKFSYDDALQNALKYFEKEAVVLDDSDDEGEQAAAAASLSPSSKQNNASGSGSSSETDIKLNLSLICPMSMAAIKTPVRGQKCKHLNCFDLRNYLHYNSKVCGGRWRCAVCEDFVAVEDLVYDGLIAKVLEVHGKDICASRDQMQLTKDGNWKLLEQNKLRYQKRKAGSLPGSSQQDENNASHVAKKGKFETTNHNVAMTNEVIDIDD